MRGEGELSGRVVPLNQKDTSDEVAIIDLDRLDPFGRFRPLVLIMRMFLLIIVTFFAAAVIALHFEGRIRNLAQWLGPDDPDEIFGAFIVILWLAMAFALQQFLLRLNGGYGRAKYRTNVPAYGRRYYAIRRQVWSRFGEAPRDVRRRRDQAASYRRLAFVFRAAPAVVVTFFAAVLLCANYYPPLGGIVIRNIAFISGAIVFVGGPVIVVAPHAAYRWMRAARGIEQALADERLRDDVRPPILYLRSFSDDVREIRSLRQLEGRITANPGSLNFEEAIALPLARVGPLIAVGQPGETVPSVGAAKEYFDPGTWHEGVLDLIRKARIIAIGLGPSRGVRWEIEQIVREGHLDRTIVILPPAGRARTFTMRPRRCRAGHARNQAACAAHLLSILERHPAIAALRGLEWSRVLLIHQRPGGGFVAILSGRGWEIDVEAAVTLAIYGLLVEPSFQGDASVIGERLGG